MKNIDSILIANRGEIASRIIRTCRKMGIKSIAIFSDADGEALFVKEADLGVHLGESAPSSSYLHQEKIIEIAKQQHVDAIHPGYGFLSENAAFAKNCQEAGLIFIGPSAAAIDAMGSKSKAKTIMQNHEVPVIPGYQGTDQSVERLVQEAKAIGFPLLLKATAGGGGKGMRIVHQANELESNIAAAKREAQSAFGEDELIIEKYIAKGRHIEFQIFGDQHGQAIHLLERECTIQRRYQKVLEESPSPILNEALRETMGAAAVKAAKALHYDNAGTVEFIFDEDNNAFYFLEVNTRLQVEHPVTEEITGLDLVAMQIEVAAGQALAIHQKEVQSNGYAIEARLYAEDPINDFLPARGSVYLWEVPQVEGLRIETAVASGSEISIHYDPMIAKLIIWDQNRATAHRKMRYTLKNLKCLGLTTNQHFLLHLFEQEAILRGDYNTHYLQQHFQPQQLIQKIIAQLDWAVIAATLSTWHQKDQARHLLKSLPSGWRSNRYAPQEKTFIYDEQEFVAQYLVRDKRQFGFQINAHKYEVVLITAALPHLSFRINGLQLTATVVQREQAFYVHLPEVGNIHLRQKERFPVKAALKVEGGYEAPMPSRIVKILVSGGQAVKKDEALMIISSMKMENTILAEKDGTVAEIYAEEGQNVEAGFLLLKVE
ncbi:MAG: biotin carboxylase N-terminal domain-containing protein [Bacteroidota bacterium]